MSGSDKLFVHLEPFIIKNINDFNPRDLSHVSYAYSVRSAGNPDLYSAIEKRWEQIIVENGSESFDYPLLHNLVYHMMFTNS